MGNKVGRILFLSFMLLCVGIMGIVVVSALRNFSVGSLLILFALLISFGAVTVIYTGNILASFFGHKVIAKVFDSKIQRNGFSNFPERQSIYYYTTSKGKVKFGTINSKRDSRGPCYVTVGYFGPFHWAETLEELTQEDIDSCEWVNVTREEVEKALKKRRRIIGIILPIVAILSIVLFISGGIMIS